MGLRWEKIWPFGIAVLAGTAWHYFSFEFPTDEKEFLAAAISLGAVLTGFIATAQAILMALPSDSVMAQIRTSGYLEELVQYISHALAGTMLFSFVSLAGFFFRDEHTRLTLTYSTIWVVTAVFGFAAFYRVSRVLMAIMKHVGPDGRP